jgi:hypothetical protein
MIMIIYYNFFFMFKHASLDVSVTTMYPSLQMQFDVNIYLTYISQGFSSGMLGWTGLV